MNLLVYQRLFHLKLYYELLQIIDNRDNREIYIITIYYFSTKNNQRPLLSNVQHEYSKLSNIQELNY